MHRRVWPKVLVDVVTILLEYANQCAVHPGLFRWRKRHWAVVLCGANAGVAIYDKFVRGDGSHPSRVVAGARKGSKSGFVRASSEGTSSDSDDTRMIQIRYLSKFGSDCDIFCEVEK